MSYYKIKKKQKAVIIGFLSCVFTSVSASSVLYDGESPYQDQNIFVLNQDNDDSYGLQFGTDTANKIEFDQLLSQFKIAKDVSFEGNQILNFRVQNETTAPTCDANWEGRMYYNTLDTEIYLCDGTQWKLLGGTVSSGGTYPYVTDGSQLIGPNTTTTLIIDGEGFTPYSTISFGSFSGVINSYSVLSPSQIEVNLSSNSTLGVYNVEVSNSGLLNTAWPGNGFGWLKINNVSGTGLAGTYTESFESGLGSWSNSSGTLNWTRDSGGTPSSSTGPTVASSGNFYVYTEASSPNYPSYVFDLETSDFSIAQSISFDYHMYGGSMGTLEVQTSFGGVWTTIQTISGQQQTVQSAAYQNSSINLVPYSVEKIRFHYTSGSSYTGDCAIDNIVIVSQ